MEPSDQKFLEALEACALPAPEFTHGAHVRAAYLYLRAEPFEAALARMRRTLRAYVAYLGKSERYDEAMTVGYMRLIHRRLLERGDPGSWSAFARDNADLGAIRL